MVLNSILVGVLLYLVVLLVMSGIFLFLSIASLFKRGRAPREAGEQES